jgi:hypothetical protein
MQLVTRKLKLIAVAFCLLVSLLPMQPSAVALPNSQPVGASGQASRVVPIFNSANSQQAVMTGYLYSSRLVFAIAPLSGSPDFYVGLPKSLTSTTGGRVKVAKVFASQSTPAIISRYSFAFNRFAVFVLEKDLIAATPAELLTPEMDIEGDFPRVTTAYSYGEYQDHTSPGSQKPCEGGPCSKDVRSLQLRILALKGKPPVSVMPNFPDQFTGQIILENSVDPKAGIACYGDGGAPVVASYRNRDLYMGAIADQFYVKACGAYPKATYDKNGNMSTFGYDTDIAINFISPVYKHTDLINRAKDYAKTLVTKKPGEVTIFYNKNVEKFSVKYVGKISDASNSPDGFRIYKHDDIKNLDKNKKKINQISVDASSCTSETNDTYVCELPNPATPNLVNDKFEFAKSIAISVAAFNNIGEGLPSKVLIVRNQKCSEYIFIGMRGSGEAYEDATVEGRVGKHLHPLFLSLGNHPTIKGGISADGVPDYKAVKVPLNPLNSDGELFPFLLETVNMTTIELSARFVRIKNACPNAKFILAGYSQGAYGVNQLMNLFEKNNKQEEIENVIAGVFLIANPAEEGRGIIPTLESIGKNIITKKVGQARCVLSASKASAARTFEKGATEIGLSANRIQKFLSSSLPNLQLKASESVAKLFDPAVEERIVQAVKQVRLEQIKQGDALKAAERIIRESVKSKSPQDLPGCQIYFVSNLLSKDNLKLTKPKSTNSFSFFYDYDYIADACSFVRFDLSKYVGKPQLMSATCGDGLSLEQAILTDPITSSFLFLDGMSRNYLSGSWYGLAGVHTKYSSNSDNWTDALIYNPKLFQAKKPFTLN